MNYGDIIPQMLKTVYLQNIYNSIFFVYKRYTNKKGSRFDCPVAPATGISPLAKIFARADRERAPVRQARKMRTRFLGVASEGEFDSEQGCQRRGSTRLPLLWHPQRESNSQLPLRRGLLYPFNYAGVLIVYHLAAGFARGILHGGEISSRPSICECFVNFGLIGQHI